LCLISAPAFAKNSADREFIIKTGIQPQAVWSDNISDENTNVGISAGVEYFKYLNNVVAIGAGATYDLPRKFKNQDDAPGDISFLPLYTAVKVRMPLRGLENNYPFLTARLGYSAFIENTDRIRTSSGGIQYGLSAGYCVGALFMEAVYSANRASYKMEGDSKTRDASYSTIALYIGVKMD
jgi:hypothetical protein